MALVSGRNENDFLTLATFGHIEDILTCVPDVEAHSGSQAGLHSETLKVLAGINESKEKNKTSAVPRFNKIGKQS